jgi:hypothetical protein
VDGTGSVTTLLVHRPGAAPEARPITAAARAGGSLADDIHLPACPPGAMRLLPCAAGVVVEAVAAGVRVAGHPVAPGARRLLRPGEQAELHGAAIALPLPPADVPTRAAAAALLRAAADGRPPGAGPALVVLSGPSAGLRLPLAGDQVLGRGRRADVVLPDLRASRLHARVRVGPGGVTVEDLRSKNGLRVNGVRVERLPVTLRAGDAVTLGETDLAVEAGLGPEPPPAAPAPSSRRGKRRGHALAAALLALSAAALALAAG